MTIVEHTLAAVVEAQLASSSYGLKTPNAEDQPCGWETVYRVRALNELSEFREAQRDGASPAELGIEAIDCLVCCVRNGFVPHGIAEALRDLVDAAFPYVGEERSLAFYGAWLVKQTARIRNTPLADAKGLLALVESVDQGAY